MAIQTNDSKLLDAEDTISNAINLLDAALMLDCESPLRALLAAVSKELRAGLALLSEGRGAPRAVAAG